MKKTPLFTQVTLVCLLLTTLTFSSCFMPRTVKGNASSSLSGTRVDFKKIMNPSFAEDYIDADVITTVEFFDPNPAKNQMLKAPKGHLVFQVIPIDGEPQKAPFGSGEIGYHVFLPKSKAGGIFDIARGTTIQLRGGTHITKSGGLGLSHKAVNFKATSMSVQ